MTGKPRHTGLIQNLWKLLNTILAELKAIHRKVNRILDLLEPGPAVGFIFSAALEGNPPKEIIMNGLNALPIDKTMILSIRPVDSKGNDAPLDGAPVWQSSNTEVLNLAAAPNGLSVALLPVGPLGAVTVTVTGDADMGTGIKPIIGSIDIQVTGGEAIAIVITPGPLTDPTPAPPAPEVP